MRRRDRSRVWHGGVLDSYKLRGVRAWSAVVVLEGSDDRLARVVIENTQSGKQQVCVLNSMQSVTRRN